MWCGRKWLLLLAIPFLSAIQARATTWHVEQDGSGDFTSIQPALDYASAGDTILIGAGHYQEYQSILLPNWSSEVDVYAYAEKDNISLVGINRELVTIGPPISNIGINTPKGIVTGPDVSDIFITNITLVNFFDGIHSYLGQLEVSECAFADCKYGFAGIPESLSLISCSFSDCYDFGVVTFAGTGNIIIDNSSFTNCWVSMIFNYSDSVIIVNSVISGGRNGIKYTGTSGEINNNVIESIDNIGIVVQTGSEVGIMGNRIGTCEANLLVTGYSTVVSQNNVFSGGFSATIMVTNGSNATLNECHIFNIGGHSVLLDGYSNPPDIWLDFENNYWGTADTEQIAEWIWDRNDDSSIHAFVDYEPFSGDPLPTEKKSLGGVKALYR